MRKPAKRVIPIRVEARLIKHGHKQVMGMLSGSSYMGGDFYVI